MAKWDTDRREVGWIHHLWIFFFLLCSLFLLLISVSFWAFYNTFILFFLSSVCLSSSEMLDEMSFGVIHLGNREQKKKLKNNMKRNLKMRRCKIIYIYFFMITLFLNEKQNQKEKYVLVLLERNHHKWDVFKGEVCNFFDVYNVFFLPYADAARIKPFVGWYPWNM